MEKLTIIRQDGNQTEIKLNADGTFDWDVRKLNGEYYVLFVVNTDDTEEAVGIFDERQDANEAADEILNDRMIHQCTVNATDYVAPVGFESASQMQALKGMTALQYINDENADE